MMDGRVQISMVKLSRVEQGLSQEFGIRLGHAQPRPEYSCFVATTRMGSREAIFPKLLQVDNDRLCWLLHGLVQQLGVRLGSRHSRSPTHSTTSIFSLPLRSTNPSERPCARLRNCSQPRPLTLTLPGRPYSSIRAAVLTVSPQTSNWNCRLPMMPAETGPKSMPMRTAQSARTI